MMSLLIIVVLVQVPQTKANILPRVPGEGPGNWDDYMHNRCSMDGWPKPGYRVSDDGNSIVPDNAIRSSLSEYEMKMADFANESYHEPKDRRPIHGHNILQASELEGDNLLDPQLFAIFVDDDNREAVLALRGTWELGDTVPDIEVARRDFSTGLRAHQSLNTLRALQRRLPSYSIILSGHSLGGTEALLLLAQDVDRNIVKHEDAQTPAAVAAAFTFNAYCDRFCTPEQYMGDAMKMQNCHCAFVNGDVLSSSAMNEAEEVAHHSSRIVILQLQFQCDPTIDTKYHSCSNFTSPDYQY